MCNKTVGLLKRFNDEGDVISLKLCLSPRNLSLSAAYSTFVEELLGPQNSRTSITPRPILMELIKLYPRFSNFGQHDSHEALRYLLDGLRQEELRLWQRAILDEMKYISKSAEEEAAKQEVRAWGKSTCLCTTVDRIFGGVLLTSLTCSHCNHIALHFEVFLDLSLPIIIDDVGAQRRHRNADSQPKTKRELKKERKAKGKKNKRKDRDRKRFERVTEEDDVGTIAYEEEGHSNHVRRGGRKSKYSRWSWEEEWDMADGEAVSQDAKNATVEQARLDTKVDEATTTPELTLENSACDGELFDIVGGDSIEGLLLLPSSEKTNTVEANTKSASSESPVGVKEASVNNKLGGKKASSHPLAACGTDSDSESYTSSSLNGSFVVLLCGFCMSRGGMYFIRSAGADGVGMGKESHTDSISAGENADLEDNLDDLTSHLSDGSALILPISPDSETLMCKDLATKLRISSAGDETAIAQPDEDVMAKKVAISPILSALPSHPTDLELCLAKFVELTELTGTNQPFCERCTECTSGDSGDSESSSKGGVRRDSVKRDLIIKPPAVLTLHLKRYFQCGRRLQKCSKQITFPINLDLRPYCSRLARLSSGEGQYRLFGVVEHSGQLRSGHYVCYVAEQSDIPASRFITQLEKPDPWPLHLYHLVCQLRRGDRRVIYGQVDDDTYIDEASRTSDARTWYYISDTHVTRTSVSNVLSAQPYLLFYQRVR
ncbi:unnamed protein product [Hydatigera taeniaeformis]|uniref:ubiquitinyl hydrolase 1 n=1 Tax=Hydatigena taeniaeformis TaxID=6205 RepID=A0A0R3X2S1_HYDTA|nr:unnamed protein product [Hydatigera taeniaeformis]